MNYKFCSNYPFEFENHLPDSEIIAKNLFGGNIGNILFQNSVVKSLQSNNTLFHGMPEKEDDKRKIDAYIWPIANLFCDIFLDLINYFTEKIVIAKKPIVIVGVGADSDSDFNISVNNVTAKAIKKFFDLLLEKTYIIGLRGIYTRDFLINKIGVPHERLNVIGCPSILYHGSHLNKNIKSNVSPQKICVHSGSTDENEAVFLNSILKKYHQSHVILTDLKQALMLQGASYINKPKDFRSLLPFYNDHFIIKEKRAHFFCYQNDLLKFFSNFDFTIGSRIHMTVASILSGTPALLIAHSTRVKELAMHLHIPHLDRKTIIKINNVQILYDFCIDKMKEFYDYYDDLLLSYKNFMKSNKLNINEEF
ncbi:MAG: polysaccharide pyruvyl transferase family protein [Desulfovibrio sp.]|nr:polysaccharide pyruvyl transferase family protein [Desulfovibrio sp.]